VDPHTRDRIIPPLRRWAQPGDINAFFGLMLDNMSDLVIMAGILTMAFGIPADIVLGRMIPGTAVGVLVGDLLYTWMAWRLAERTRRDDVCAMPLGLDTPSTFVFCLAIIGPVFLDATARGMTPHDAGMVAWKAGMAILVLTGLVKVAVSFVGTAVRDWIPRAGLLGSIAAVATVLISFLPALEVFASPIAGFLSLGIILVAVIGGRTLPFRFPAAFGAVLLGGIVYYVLVALGIQSGKGWTDALAGASFHVALPIPTLAFLDGLGPALQYLPIAVPMAIMTVVGGIDCTESAAAAGDEYNTRDILLVEGFATVLGGLCGGVLQSTPYIGHPAYKRMGGRAAYTLATALFIGLGGVFGYLSFFVDLIPRAATAPILIFVGLEITAQAFTATPSRHAPAVAIAFIPVIADLIIVELGQFLPAQNGIPPQMQGVHQTLLIMANGFIFISMVWAGATAFITDRRYAAAASLFFGAAVLTSVGIMHSPFATGEMYLPWLLSGAKAHLVYTVAFAYLLLAVGLFLLRWIPEQREHAAS